MESTEITIALPTVRKNMFSDLYIKQLQGFVNGIRALNERIDIEGGISTRGWCYILEGLNVIDKTQFRKVVELINDLRKQNYLPMNICTEDENRSFDHVEELSGEKQPAKEYLRRMLTRMKSIETLKNDAYFWKHQAVYVQMMVEKIDVFNLFNPICKKYHIPLANAKGWSDLNSRYNLALRFKEAEENGKVPVLLYYGDFDPAGLLIANKIQDNIASIKEATDWEPKNLIVDRFGLDYSFIEENHLVWIDNLKTGGNKDANENLDYVRDYVRLYGRRKCEANAILRIKDVALRHCEKTIKKYLGNDPFKKYNEEIAEIHGEVKALMNKINLTKNLDELISKLDRDTN